MSLLYSWGNYPDNPQLGLPCRWQSDVPLLISQITKTVGSTLAYGLGRSYGDSCLAASGNVIQMAPLDRMLAVDWSQGVIRAEAGITLDVLLKIIIPQGWFLAVTPGTRFVTLGGAIANDVHGKNHHRRGTFGNHVRRLGLWRQGEYLICSPTEHPELFAATLGGLGLTAIILWAEISLIPIKASQIESHVGRFGNLAEFFDLSDQYDQQHEYSVAWVDCLAQKSQQGRGVFIRGDHSIYGDLSLEKKKIASVPITPPISLINSLSLKAFNHVYWNSHPKQFKARRLAFEPFFYPLDRLYHWNRIYGRKGFQQYQCVLPDAVAKHVLPLVLKVISDSGQGSFLAVLKRCGDIPSPGLLSFPLPGISLALDFPQHSQLLPLFSRLDALVHEAGGRLYPAKDAHMTGKDFRRAYPTWEHLEALRDPALNSCFWTRVTT